MLTAYMKAENLKNRHTVSAKLFWLVPSVSILTSYLLGRGNVKFYQMNQYNWWYTIFFPMLLLLSIAFAGQREKKLKNRAMGVLPVDLKKLWGTKVIYCIKTLLLSVLILYGVQEIVSRFMIPWGNRDISSGAGLAAIALMVVLSLWQIPLWMWINQLWGFAASILLGLAGNIGLGILAASSKWWVLNPFSYICRLMCPILGILPNGMEAEPGNPTFTPEILKVGVIPVGVGISLLLFIICYLLTARWYAGKGKRGWEN